MKVITSDLATGGATVWHLKDHSLKLRKICQFGELNRQKYIQKFATFNYEATSYLIIGRKGLYLDIYDITANDEFRYLKTKRLITTKNESDFFIDVKVFIDDKKFMASTGLGYCYFIDIDMILGCKYYDFSMSFGLHGSISFFKLIRTRGNDDDKIIVGGKDRELNMMELENHTNIWKSKSIKKNSKEKELEPYNGVLNKEPLWIQDIIVDQDNDCEISTENMKIIAATRFGKLLFYVPSLSKFPIDELQIFENPIKHLIKINKELLIIADSFDTVLLFNYQAQNIINSFNFKTGALSSITIHNMETSSEFLLFISSNTDKRLTIYLVSHDGDSQKIDSVEMDGISPELFLLDVDELPPCLKQRRSQKRARFV